MINWFDMPAEGLSNGGLFEVKELEVTENGTYETSGEMYNKVTVNVEGGGSSWQTVFEGSVTTSGDEVAEGLVEGLSSLSANSIKVAFGGTEYTCEKDENGNYGAPQDSETGEFDFSEYPFAIGSAHDMVTVWTPTAGTYTLKIEEQSGGGSSDFSTAEVTITNNSSEEVQFYIPTYMDIPNYGTIIQSFIWTNSEEPTFEGEVVIPTNGQLIVGSSLAQFTTGNTAVTGNAIVEGGQLIITGDCTITIS